MALVLSTFLQQTNGGGGGGAPLQSSAVDIEQVPAQLEGAPDVDTVGEALEALRLKILLGEMQRAEQQTTINDISTFNALEVYEGA